MDRTAWIVVTLCVVSLILWQWWVAKHTVPRPSTSAASPTASPPVSASASVAPLLSPTPAAAPQAAEELPGFAEKTETLRNADVELHLTNRGGGITEAVLLNHIAEEGKRVTLNSPKQIPIGAIIDAPATPVLPEFTLSHEADGSLRCVRVTPENVTIQKKFFFPKTEQKKDDFVAEMNVDFRNDGPQPYLNNGYFVALGSAGPIHPRDYSYYTRLVWCVDGRAKGIDVNRFAPSGGFLGLVGQRPEQPFFQQDVPNLQWAAVSDQFFTTLIAPLTGKGSGVWGHRFDISPERKTYGIYGALRMPAFQVLPGQTYNARFEIWVGPKIYHRLAQLDHNEAEIMDFGMFKLVCQFLLNFMNLLHSWLGNYAAAILALTTIIKLVLWPIQNKANRSMRQMAVLSPKMQELREKYKDDPTRMNQEVMKLYKEYGINPVGGCLPMVIQIPIFFGLFKMLGQAVELRNAKFLWVRDLSQPDTVAHLPVLGWPVNIIPLCMAATQIWLMQMTPKTGDATQRRVMMFTPLIFLFICYNFAAALALYYTTQNIFSILQFYQNKNQPMPTLEKVAVARKRAAKNR